MPLNFAILKQWENWVTIILMLIIACFATNLVAKLISKNEGSES